jgi:hypothetical protein
MEDSYGDNFSKLALAATSAQIAKIYCVKEFGVGEDLTFNFMGWNNDELVIICQMTKEMMKIHPDERLEKCTMLVNTLRKYWGITAITMVAEGYCSMDPEKTKGVELAKAFAKPDSGVEECLTLTHAELFDDNSIEVNLVALPYTYQLGKTVSWFEMLSWPNKASSVLRNSKYPIMLEKSLKIQIDESEIPPEAYDELRRQMTESGFHMQEFF